MTDIHKPKPADEKRVACKVCMKEVPLSAAKSEEAQDYVFYFCGPDCYEKWCGQEEADNLRPM